MFGGRFVRVTGSWHEDRPDREIPRTMTNPILSILAPTVCGERELLGATDRRNRANHPVDRCGALSVDSHNIRSESDVLLIRRVQKDVSIRSPGRPRHAHMILNVTSDQHCVDS
jgi:hypothetical protein